MTVSEAASLLLLLAAVAVWSVVGVAFVHVFG